MKKICFVTTVSMTLDMFVVETAVSLIQTRLFDVTFICDKDDKFASSLPTEIHYHPIAMRRGISLDGFKVIQKMTDFFKAKKFDVIQYSTPNASLYAAISAKKARIPVRLYAQWGIRYMGMQGMQRVIFKTLEKIVCTKSTDIRAVSRKNRDFAVSEGLYKREKAVVLGEGGTIGVDLKKYDLDQKRQWRNAIREKYSISDEPVFGFAGRISIDKGGRELLTAFKRLVESGCDAHLLVVGPNETYDKQLVELLQWARQDRHVTFTGLIPKTDMCQYYAAMDVLVHPTYREGFGMVLQEAAAMSAAVLTTRIPGASEVMEENISCLLTDPRNAEALQKQMERFLKEPDLIEKLGSAARKRVDAHFERSMMIERQIEDYRELVSDKKPYDLCGGKHGTGDTIDCSSEYS